MSRPIGLVDTAPTSSRTVSIVTIEISVVHFREQLIPGLLRVVLATPKLIWSQVDSIVDR